MNDLQAYPCGTIVIPKTLKRECLIVGISIRFDSVLYQLQYAVGDEFHEIWMKEQEFNTAALKQQVGFKNGS